MAQSGPELSVLLAVLAEYEVGAESTAMSVLASL
jgi:hypothetical protein